MTRCAQFPAVLAILPAIALGSATDELSQTLRQSSIQPIEPSSAVDFELPDLDGKKFSLSASKGRWVLLTFFATWCGPCKVEMPTLMRLRSAIEKDGVDIIAVSTDSEPGIVKAFLRQNEIDLPVLLDRDGRVSSRYRASSIPVSYLINPSGQIVGVARGARDWAALEPMMRKLLTLQPTDPNATSAYADSGMVSLPANVTPPGAIVSLSTPAPLVGEKFALDVRVRWAGTPSEYVMHPPELKLPDGVKQEGVSASTSSHDGKQTVTYAIALRAEKEGKFALDPVELRYTPAFDQQPLATRVQGPTVAVKPVNIAGLPPRTFAVVVLGVLLAGMLGGWAGRRFKARKEAAAPTEHPYDRVRHALDEARRARVQGKISDFLERLAAIERVVGNSEGPASRKELEDAIQQAKYGGEAPADSLLNRIERRVERGVEKLRPAPDDELRKSIRLQE